MLRRALFTMLNLCVCAPAAYAAAPAEGDRPSVAVFAFEFRGDASLSDASKLLTESVVEELRETNAFSRVVASAELEAVLGLERQKQLLSCDQQSCMSELGGALGVDYLVTGTVGRLGKSYVLIVKMLEVRNARAVASFKQRAPIKDKAVLLDIAELAVKALVRDAKLKRGPPLPDAMRPAAPAPAPTPAPAPNPAQPTPKDPPPAAPTPAPSAGTTPFPRRGPSTSSPPNVTVVIQQAPAPAPAPDATPPPASTTTRETAAAPDANPTPGTPVAMAPAKPAKGLSPVRLALVGGGGAALAAGVAAVLLGLAAGASGWGLKAFINLVPFYGVKDALVPLKVTYVTLWMAGMLGIGAAVLILMGGGIATAVGWALPD